MSFRKGMKGEREEKEMRGIVSNLTMIQNNYFSNNKSFFPSFLSFPYILLAFFILISCSPGKLETKQIDIERDGQVIATLKAELAITPEERNRGLMHRKKLPDGEGMLFVFERDQIMSFWMKNTLIPLSIAYITSDGRIIDIKDMYPRDENSVVSSRSARYALEVPQGWFQRAGVREGDRVRVEQVGSSK